MYLLSSREGLTGLMYSDFFLLMLLF